MINTFDRVLRRDFKRIKDLREKRLHEMAENKAIVEDRKLHAGFNTLCGVKGSMLSGG
jgi:hypothetical protein